MDIGGRLFVRPISWSVMDPSASDMRENPTLFPCIQIFGYTHHGKTVYIRIPKKSTFILRFSERVDNDMADDITDILSPSSVKFSNIDPNVLIIRAPELSPIELTANPEFEGLATWTGVKQDPYGELESLWETREIGPYEWIMIEKFMPIPGKYTTCDFNIRTDENYIFSTDNIDLPKIFPRLFFWDIEVFSSNKDEFPNSSHPGDFVVMISIITASREGSNNYVIVKGNVNTEYVNKRQKNLVLVRASDEKDLLVKFFGIYNVFAPDRQIYYNGDMFDMPYILNRLDIHGYEIPKISKIPSLIPPTFMKSFPTPFGRENALTISLPGTEIIDLVEYYRRFYPHFKNHRLDTVAKAFIGEGKTGLTISDMMDAIRTDNPDKMANVVDYSFVDSLRMKQLWDVTNVQENFELICNNLGISMDVLLRSSFEDIIDRAVYNIDAGSAIMNGTYGRYGSPGHLKDAVKGIYKDVYIYDYSEIYRSIMLSSGQTIATMLANRLEGAPPKLIMTAFYSIYTNRSKLLSILDNVLEVIMGTNMIISVEPFIIRSVGELDINFLKLLDKSSSYVSVSKSSYIILDKSGELETAGLSKLCRPKFSLASDVIKQYLSLAYSGKLTEFSVPDMKNLSMDKFILAEKLGDISSAKPDSVKYKLASQYGSVITTWVSVKYIMSQRGPLLLSEVKDDDLVDHKYYTAEINKYVKDLKSLKIYGM